MPLLTNIPFELDADSLMQSVLIESGSDDEQEFRDFIRESLEVGNPKAVYRECFIDEKGEDTVTAQGITFTSRTMRKNLEDVERFFAYVATCGMEMNEHDPSSGDFLKEFWWDTIKARLLQAATTYLFEHIIKKFALTKTATMHPGSGDAEIWPIDQQDRLFSLIGDVHGQTGVELTDTFLMVPNKTVSGIRFATEKDFRSCQVCHREKCASRTAAFNKKLWELIQHD